MMRGNAELPRVFCLHLLMHAVNGRSASLSVCFSVTDLLCNVFTLFFFGTLCSVGLVTGRASGPLKPVPFILMFPTRWKSSEGWTGSVGCSWKMATEMEVMLVSSYCCLVIRKGVKLPLWQACNCSWKFLSAKIICICTNLAKLWVNAMIWSYS